MRWPLRALAAVAALQILAIPAFCADKKKSKPLSAAEVLKRAAPGVVTIDCLGDNNAKSGGGSGSVVGENGQIITNLSVIVQCRSLTIRLSNGDAYDSVFITDVDARRDLVVIRVKAASLPILALGDSNDVEVGQVVYSMGAARTSNGGLQQGSVSGIRQMNGYRLLQLSASLDPASFGGPILDDQGRMIGIAAGLKSDGGQNAGFAMPINYAKGYLDTKTEVPFTTFAAAMQQANAANKAQAAASRAGAGVVGGIPGGVIGFPAVAPPPPPPPPAGGAVPSCPPVSASSTNTLTQEGGNGQAPPSGSPPVGGIPTPRIRVSSAVATANLISKAAPVYPPLARQARIAGTVRYEAVINKDGTVQSLQLSCGHPLLAPAASAAIKQWIFKPTLVNGQPVEVATQLDVNFTLSN